MRCFWSAKTCSILARSRDRAALARARGSGIGLARGLRKWTLETRPAASIRRSFFAERYAVSAQTGEPAFALSSSPGSSRPAWRAASVTDHLRRNR
jgi:hypothetical protein